MVNHTPIDTPYRVLAVDDEPAVLAVLVQILSDAGFEVIAELSGESALKQLNSRKFDLVITDVRMTGITGFELISCAEQVDPTLKMVVMTGYDSYQMLQTALRAGAHDYLTKPMDDHKLVVHVANRSAQATRLVRRNNDLVAQLRASHGMLERVNLKLRELNEELRIQANTDALTELYNRRYIDDSLLKEVTRRNRYLSPLSVALIDVDHFKLFNDQHGHKGGDDALKIIAETLAVCARTTDVVGRYGGEEFLVILPNTTPENALRFAERVRTSIAEQSMNLGGLHAKITASIGVSGVDEAYKNAEASDLVGAADRALYAAKAAGRDCVLHEPLGSDEQLQLKAG